MVLLILGGSSKSIVEPSEISEAFSSRSMASCVGQVRTTAIQADERGSRDEQTESRTQMRLFQSYETGCVCSMNMK